MDTEKKPDVPAWLLTYISELSQTARTMHTVYVGFLIYCVLTILGISDRKLALDEAVHLPIINVEVSFSGFVLVGPLVTILTYIYFQLHLQVLRRAISSARNSYGEVNEEKLYPWMITLEVKSEDGAVRSIQERLVKISLWWLLPLVLFLFTILTLKTHDAGLILFAHLMSLAGIILVCHFRVNYERPAKDTEQLPASNVVDRSLNRFAPYLEMLSLVTTVAIAYIALWGLMAEDNAGKSRHFYLDLSGQVLVEEHKEEYGNVYWHDFRGKHFEGADLSNSILKRANLQQSHLEGACLENTSMQGANLNGANLSNAVLNQVKFEDAHFRDAILNNMVLSSTDISKSDFTGATLFDAVLINANLCGNEKLTTAQLSEARIIFNSEPKCEEEKQKGNLYALDEVRKNYAPDIIEIMGRPPRSPNTGIVTGFLDEHVYNILQRDVVISERWTHTSPEKNKEYIYREELFRYPASCPAIK
jgi:hypothetical protein